MSAVIETKNLTKSYGRTRGVADVSLAVEEGEIFGFIGPNGAGKSTTIRTLLSLIHKTSGEARIFGLDCEADKVKILKDVGYLPSEVFYYDNMRAVDLFKYSASFYKKDCSKKIGELASLLQLDLHKKIEDMSLGNKKKVGIIQGLLHSPRLIILDEPTSGLDPLMQKTFFDLIKKENARGATVLFSSHILSEVQRICDRVAIIKDGRIVSVQKINELQQSAYKAVSFTARAGADLRGFAVPGAQNLEISGQSAGFIFKGDVNALLTELGRYPLVNVDITEPTLEEIFMHYYSE
ncbi:ABC-2 type transport system ATP-binding protein [Sporobacter termitidis DSM 10068]|uniref:ABC-2 type transport system ATP-binding protein n=1 Tax=Sporobacter termitidis DSM 10068 TaxID=1123282 RepID=A0A1M5WXJ8_9FIRM|nr:ABC transporter ATP-binding protein [Sporobacter termitidis]SHH91884.1 ABC-2 type transport system ATP-binding protein [Sporobacter termitidis DSM 10068]